MTAVMGKKHPVSKDVVIPSAEQIRAMRGKLTQAEAADKIGVEQPIWSAWERGLRSPSKQSARLLRRTFGKPK